MMKKSHETRVVESRFHPSRSAEREITDTIDVNSAVAHLSQFFSGQLKCNACNVSIAFNSNELTLHQQTCPKNEKNQRDRRAKSCETKSQLNSKQAEKSAKLDNSQKFSNSNIIEQFQKYRNKSKSTVSLDLWHKTSNTWNSVDILKKIVITTKSFQCLYCKVFSSIDSWQKHVFECPVTTNLSLSCVCLLCETLIYGEKESVIAHPHFKENQSFFSLSHYPHLTDLLKGNSPRFFKFDAKLLRLSEDDLKLGFYCVVCDLYCFQRLEKHLYSYNHRARANLTCDLYYCDACFIIIYGDERLISYHKLSRNHIMMETRVKQNTTCLENPKHRFLLMSLKFIIEKNLKENENQRNFQCLSYYCDLCFDFVKSKDDWDAHLASERHIQTVDQATTPSDVKMFEYNCIFCKLSVFGTIFNHIMHTSSYGHENIKNYVINYHNTTNVTAIKEASENLNQAVAFPNESKPKEKSVEPKGKPVIEDFYRKNLEVKNHCELAFNVREFLLDTLKKTQLEKCNTYNCWYCDFFSSERKWWIHLQSQPHIDKVNQYSQSSKSYKAVTLFCYCCNFLVLGPKFVQNLHLKKSLHVKKASKFSLIKSDPKKPKVSESSQSSDPDVMKNSENNFKTVCNGTCPDVLGTSDELPECSRARNASGSTLFRSQSMSSNSSNQFDNDEKSECEDEGDELYNVILNGESDADDRVSDHELDESFLNEIKDDLPVSEGTSASKDPKVEDDKGAGAEKDNTEIIKHLIIVKGIPPQIVKNRRICFATFNRYAEISRIFTKKSTPDWLYLVVLAEPEEAFNRLNRNIKTLKVKLGTDELSFEHDTRNTDNTGIKKQLTQEVEEIFSNEMALNEAVNELMNSYDQESVSDESRSKIRQLEKNVLNLARTIYGVNWPIKVFVFGSRVTGLATENSDVDIYLQINHSFGGGYHNNTSLQQQLVLLFSNKMKQYYSDFKNVVSIPFARVPIVKFTDAKSKLNCDLSFKSGLSTMNSMLVKTYLELDDRIKFIVCGVKLWMKKNDLSDRNLFTTYATIWMVFYFLMQPEISVVPSVLAIRNELPASQRMVIVEDWNCAFPNLNNIRWRSKCTLTKEQLLLKFFEFYSEEKLLNYVMCTLTGLKLPKKFFLESYDNLPPSFNEFKLRVRDRTVYWKVSDDFVGLCVQDPFDHCHNLTKTINVRKFNGFINLCQQTVQKMRLIDQA